MIKFTAIYHWNYKKCVLEIHRNSPSKLLRVCCRNSLSDFLRHKHLRKFTAIYRRNYLECVVEIHRNSLSKLLSKTKAFWGIFLGNNAFFWYNMYTPIHPPYSEFSWSLTWRMNPLRVVLCTKKLHIVSRNWRQENYSSVACGFSLIKSILLFTQTV